VVQLQRDIFQGLVLLRILHAAAHEPVSGVELGAQLDAVGHRVGPGTLYPLLHRLEKSGWLKSTGKTVKGKRRRYYRITKKGRIALVEAQPKLLAFVAGILGPSVLLSTAAAAAAQPRVVDVDHLRVLLESDGAAPLPESPVAQTPHRPAGGRSRKG